MQFFTSRFTTIQNYLASQAIPTKDIANLFTWKYWNDTAPPSSTYNLATLGAVFILILLLLAWQFLLKRKPSGQKIYQYSINQISNITIFIVLISASYLFFCIQQISYLSSRLVVLVSILIVLVWLVLTIYNALKVAPSKYRQHLEEERYFRYIPKKKGER